MIENILNTYVCIFNEPIILADFIYLMGCISWMTFKFLSGFMIGYFIYDYFKKRKCR